MRYKADTRCPYCGMHQTIETSHELELAACIGCQRSYVHHAHTEITVITRRIEGEAADRKVSEFYRRAA